MSRLSVTACALIAAGFLPLSAAAGPNDAGSAEGKSSAPGILSGTEELGREAQRELARLGCFSGDVNASWGRESRAAVKRFSEATKSVWPDWPSSDLVRSLWTFPDGYCLKCETCTAASTGARKGSAKAEAAAAEKRRKAAEAAAAAEKRRKAAEAAAAAEKRRKAAEAAAEAERRRKAAEAAAEAERRKKAAEAAAEAEKRRKAAEVAAEAEKRRKAAEAAAERAAQLPRPQRPRGSGFGGGGGWPNGGPADSVGR